MNGLTTVGVQTLTTTQIMGLDSSAVTGLNTAHVAALTSSQLAALTPAEIGGLDSNHVGGLSSQQIAAITTTAVTALTSNQMGALGSAFVAAITTAQISALTTSAITGFSTDGIKGLTTVDIARLTTSQIQALTTAQIVALETKQFTAMTTTDIIALTSAQIRALETVDIAALHSANLTAAFTPTQLLAMNGRQTTVYLTSPLVLDLAGTGIKTLDVSAGVQYDLTATGSKQQVGWIGAGSGFLVRDINHDGVINNGSEMFGNGTTLASGAKASDGFQALAQLDSNHDGVINAKDAAFSELGVWVDTNSDGITQPGEIYSLNSLGITQFNLNAVQTAVNNNGNWILQDSSYVTSNGTTHQMADVWFQNGTTAPAVSTSLTAQSQALVTTPVASLSVAPIQPPDRAQLDSLNNGGVNPFSTAPVTVMQPEPIQSLKAAEIYSLLPEQGTTLTPADGSAAQVGFTGPAGNGTVQNGNLTSLQNLPATASLLPGNQFQGIIQQGQLAENVTVTGAFPQPKPNLLK